MTIKKVKSWIKFFLLKLGLIDDDDFKIILSSIMFDLPNFEIKTKNNKGNIRKKQSPFFNEYDERKYILHTFDICNGELWHEVSRLEPIMKHDNAK